MDLAAAIAAIAEARTRAERAYGRPVFDEWAVMAVADKKVDLLAYEGPQFDTFRRDLAANAEIVAATILAKELEDGDIEFAADRNADVLVRLGPGRFLILKNTSAKVAVLRQTGRWPEMQRILFGLAEQFRISRLE